MATIFEAKPISLVFFIVWLCGLIDQPALTSDFAGPQQCQLAQQIQSTPETTFWEEMKHQHNRPTVIGQKRPGFEARLSDMPS